jgi:zinc protease
MQQPVLRHLRVSLALILFAALVSAPASAQRSRAPAQPAQPAAQAPAQAQLVTTVEGISEYTLANGLRILLFPDASRPSTTVNITYYVGSRHEAYGESGMAHLLEHLVFKGTPTHPDIPGELTRHGGRANGTTWFDRTNYFITFPATPENLEWAVRLEADRMVNSFVRQEDLASEMTVVRNEFESGENNPFRVLMQRTMATAYEWHGYGRSTIGARADIENVPIERLKGFYRKYYQPDNAIIAISGRFDPQQTLRWVERYFGAIPRPDRTGTMQIWPTYTREPAQDGERSVTVRRVGDVQYLMASYHVPSGAHEDFAAADLIAHVLSNAPAGRLYKALVEPGKASSVGAFAFQLNEPGPLLIFAEVRTEQSLDEARAIVARVVDSLSVHPPTEEEVTRARAARIRDIQLSINNSERVGIDLTEWAATGDWRLMFIHRDRVRAVSVEDVARVARTYLVPSNRTVGLFRPEAQPQRAEIPAVPDIKALTENYRGTETIATGEAFESTNENIDARTRRTVLENGFKVALLPKQTRGNTVLVQFQQRMGSESELMHRSQQGSLAAGMLMRGTTKRGRQALTDTLARLQTQMNVGGSATLVSSSIETTRGHLMAVLQLLQEVLREPAFDAQEFETLKRQRLAGIESQRSEPGPLASIALQRHMNPYPAGHPMYVETIDETIAALTATTLDEVRAFHRNFYGFGAGGNITVLGDFDPAEVETFARGAFSGPAPARRYVRIDPVLTTPAPTSIRIDTPDKANAFFAASFNFKMRDDHPDYAPLMLGGYMFGGGFLNSRLASRLRQRDGLSYGVGGGISARPLDEIGTLGASAIYAPQNMSRLVAAFREELELAVREGFTAEEVAAAKQGWLQSRDVGRSTDGQLLNTINNGLFTERTMADAEDLEARVRAVTAAQVLAAMQKWIDPSKVSIAVGGDFKPVP